VRYPSQWALPKIGWDLVYGNISPSGSAKVALLDTRRRRRRIAELFGKVVPGTSILDGTNGMTDPSGHGTWLAGIIAANTNNVTGHRGCRIRRRQRHAGDRARTRREKGRTAT
jgi:hypothetical protein